MNPKKEIDLKEIIKLLWRHRLKICVFGVYGAIIGVIIAISIPNTYTSHSTLAPEEKHKELSGTASTIASMMGVNTQNADGISSVLYPIITSSTPFIMEFANIDVTYGNQKIPLWEYLLNNQKEPWWSYIISLPKKIFKEETDTTSLLNSKTLQSYFVDAMRESVIVTQDDELGTIYLTSRFQDPKIAQLVADSVIKKLQRYMVEYKTANTRSALISNTQMFEDAKKEYFLSEERYASEADRNQNIIKRSALINLERLRNQRDLAYQIYNQLALQVGTDRVKLHQEEAITTVIEPPTFPIKPSSPRKVLLVGIFCFLSLCIYSLQLALKFIHK